MRDVQAPKPGALAVVGACLAAVVLLAQNHPATPHRHPEGQKLKNPVASTPASITAGSKMFAKFCMTCHGAMGKGDGSGAPEGSHPANFTDAIWQHGSSDGEVYMTIHDGIGPDYFMDSWEGKIPDQEIWNLVNYVKSLSKK